MKKISLPGVVLGVVLGVIAGVLSGAWLLWLALGVAIGIVIGSRGRRRKRDSRNIDAFRNEFSAR